MPALRFLCCALALLFAAFTISEASAAPSTTCRTAKPAKTKAYWSWRLIDGKRCWYIGKPRRAKSTLHWPTRTVRRAPRRMATPLPPPPPPAPPPVEIARDDDPLLSSVWPELPPVAALPPPMSPVATRWPDYSLPRLPIPPREEWPSPSLGAFALVTPAAAAEAQPRINVPPTLTPAMLLLLIPGALMLAALMMIEMQTRKRARRPFQRFA